MNREKLIQTIAAKRKYTAEQHKKFAERIQAMSDCEVKEFFAAELGEQPAGDPPAVPPTAPPAGDPPAAPAPSSADEDAKPVTMGDLKKFVKETMAPAVTAAVAAATTKDQRVALVAELKARGVELSDEDAASTPITALQQMAKALPPRMYIGASGGGAQSGGQTFSDVVMAEAGEGCPEWMKQ